MPSRRTWKDCKKHFKQCCNEHIDEQASLHEAGTANSAISDLESTIAAKDDQLAQAPADNAALAALPTQKHQTKPQLSQLFQPQLRQSMNPTAPQISPDPINWTLQPSVNKWHNSKLHLKHDQQQHLPQRLPNHPHQHQPNTNAKAHHQATAPQDSATT